MKKSAVFAIIFCTVVLAAIVFFGVFFTVKEITVRYDNDVTSADKQAVLSVIDIDAQTNIFSVNEKKIKQKVETAFPDNSIEVSKVVRSFPNKVTVVVRERTQLFKIGVKNTEKFVAADKDFRRSAIHAESDLTDKKLINVIGFEIVDSFAVEACYQLKDFANALVGAGFNVDSITTFVKTIEFSDNKMTVTLFDGATFSIDRSNVGASVTNCLNAYLALPYAERSGHAFA